LQLFKYVLTRGTRIYLPQLRTANSELWKPATGAELYFRFRAILVRNYAGEVIDKEINYISRLEYFCNLISWLVAVSRVSTCLVFPLQTGYNVVEVGPAPSQLADFEPFFASGFSYNCRTCHQATAAPPWPPSNVFLFLFLTFFFCFLSASFIVMRSA